MNRRRKAVQESFRAVGGVIGIEAQRKARARARRRSAWARGSTEKRRGFPRRVTPMNLDWLTQPDARGHKRGILSGQSKDILSYLRHWFHTRPNMKVRAYGTTYLRVSIRQIARAIGRNKSGKNVWLCLRQLEKMEIIVRRRMRHHVKPGVVVRRRGRPPLRGPCTVNGVGLIKFTPVGRKLCEIEKADHLQEIKTIRDTPAYSGPGAWGRVTPEQYLGSDFFGHLQERFPGILRKLQLGWGDFCDTMAERESWPGNESRHPSPSAGSGGPSPPEV